MPVLDGNEFEGHGGSSVNGIFIATGRTETGFTAERDELEVAAGGAGIHGTSERRVTTMKHLVNVFNDGLTRMQSINHFFIIITKNILKYTAHVIIIEE